MSTFLYDVKGQALVGKPINKKYYQSGIAKSTLGLWGYVPELTLDMVDMDVVSYG